jgi:hypothetical protein
MDYTNLIMKNPIVSGIMDNSPIIIAIIFTSFSFIFQNWSGAIYLGYLLAAVVLRLGIMNINKIIRTLSSKSDPAADASESAEFVSCEKQGISVGFSTFVFMFTFWYAFTPMFIFNDLNIPLLITFILYFIFDLLYKRCDQLVYIKCTNFGSLILYNFFGGGILGTIFCTSMMAGGSGKFLFFNEISTSKEMCSVKKEQAFKCKVNK